MSTHNFISLNNKSPTRIAEKAATNIDVVSVLVYDQFKRFQSFYFFQYPKLSSAISGDQIQIKVQVCS